MFDFKKLCNEYESLSTVERGVLLAEKSAVVLAKLHTLNIEEIDPIETYVAFILGAIVSDGVIDEKEYLLMYPALVKTFGNDFDFQTIKTSFKKDKEGRSMIKKYNQDMVKIMSYLDESLVADLISLCLLIVSVDGKVTLKERHYIKKLYK